MSIREQYHALLDRLGIDTRPCDTRSTEDVEALLRGRTIVAARVIEHCNGLDVVLYLDATTGVPPAHLVVTISGPLTLAVGLARKAQ
jgi:hypothetical protein